jgi:hypothetical protein
MAHEPQHEQHYHDAANVTNPEHASHHIVTPRVYAAVFATLLACTALTVFAADINLGVFNPIIALAIASFKGVIVILFFMQISVAPHQGHGRRGLLHVPRAGHHDALRLHQPRLGPLVARLPNIHCSVYNLYAASAG